ncbi:MAG: hypothetical protein M3Z15_12420, partial [Pseudomonadota bacterium]|nr:hypothetical protein [Pseudomonadota bacterium]
REVVALRAHPDWAPAPGQVAPSGAAPLPAIPNEVAPAPVVASDVPLAAGDDTSAMSDADRVAATEPH